tara:strand:- start:6181 stop:6420 length:240 start_codon:yes stop_codon:yes gene_type:complete
MTKLRDWALEGNMIVKDFGFGSFRASLEFVNKVGEIAEEKNHHPDFLVSREKVRLSLRTHDEEGLSSEDFDLAEEIDKL